MQRAKKIRDKKSLGVNLGEIKTTSLTQLAAFNAATGVILQLSVKYRLVSGGEDRIRRPKGDIEP